MNGGIDPVFYGVVCGVTLWLALLWLGERVGIRRRGRGPKLAFGAATVLLLFVPCSGGLPLWNWVFSFCPNPSLPMLGVVSAALWQRLGGMAVLRREDWRAVFVFGAAAGTILYLQPLLLPGFDLYYWGWHHAVAVWGLAALALTALAAGNRSGVLLLAALIGYEVEALESHNAWDYAVDPFFWLTSLGVLGWQAAARLRDRWTRATPAAAVAAER